MSKEINYYDTFATNLGTLDQRINHATGLSGKDQLLEVMDTKSKNTALDILLENECNQNCIGCYFQEHDGKGAIKVTKEMVEDIRQMIQVLKPDDPDLFMFYPREITTSPQLLSVYTEEGMDRVLTNGKLLHKDGVIKKLKEFGIKRISITVSGRREVYSMYTREPADTYDQLLSNISLAIKSGFSISIFMPVFKQNIDDVIPTVLDLYLRGVPDIKFLRVVPEGQAKTLPDEMFLNHEDILKFLRNVNNIRHKVGNKMNLGLFTGYFGPNFYNFNTYKYLSGEISRWPKSKYFCPMINQQYVGVSFGSNDVYSCFASLSFPEDFKIGKYENGTLKYSKQPISSDWLNKNLRGLCSKENCEEQEICLGGCRVIPFSWAKRKGENDPITSGQDFCLTQTLKEIGA